MRIGDKVRLLYNQNVEGVILEKRPSTQMWLDDSSSEEYLVEYSKEGYIPPKDWHPESYLSLLKDELSASESQCDCGGEYTTTKHHFSWCRTRK